MQIPGFEMIEKLGQGGMATVWKARQVSLDRIVAIKILSSRFARDTADIERFQKEAQSAAKLKHQGIVQVYDANIANGLYYFVMEYIGGYTVGDWLRRKGKIPELDALLVSECVADALEYAWDRQKIIHCDIKPDNVMVDADGTVKVSDLGLARTINAMSKEETVDEVMGTPAYISPEQAEGRADIDFRADIYSLGAMLYHLVTGKMLFEGHSEEEIMELQSMGTVPDAFEVNPEISPHVSSLIEIMLSKKKEYRQKSWKDVKIDIARVKRHLPPTTSLPPEGVSTMQRSPTRLQKAKLHRGGRAVVYSSTIKSSVVSDEGKNKNVLLAILGAVGIVVLLILFFVHQKSRQLPQQGVSPKTPKTSVSQTSTVTGQKEDADSARAKDLFEFAQSWVQNNPNDLSSAIEKFKKVALETRGTRYALMAEDEIKRLSSLLEEKKGKVIDELQKKAGVLIEEGRFNDAAALYEEYNGLFASETAELRKAYAAQLKTRHLQAEMEKKKAEQKIQEKIQGIRRKIAISLLTNGVQNAVNVMRISLQDPDLQGEPAPLGEIRHVLDAALSLDDKVMDTFAKEKGKEITVKLVNTKVTMTVDDVQFNERGERKVVGREKMGGDGSARITIPRSFTVKDLAASERFARMGSDDNYEVALTKGVMAVSSKAYSQAKEYFSKTLPSLAESILPEINRLEIEQAEAGACESLRTILKTLGINVEGNDPSVWTDIVRNASLSKEGVTKLKDLIEAYKKKFAGNTFLDKAQPVLDVLLEKVTKVQEAQAVIQPPEEEKEGTPLTLEKDSIDPGKLLKNILAVNPSVSDDEVEIIEEEEGRITKIVMISEQVCEISPLSQLKNIKILHCGAVPFEHSWVRGVTCRVRNISALRNLPLEELYLGGCLIKDLTTLKGMRLRVLDIRDTEVEDLSPLNGMPLEYLDVSRTKIKDLGVIRTLPKLKRFKANGVKAYEFRALSELKLIEELDLSDTQLRDVGFLKNTALRNLNIANTKVYDFGILKNMPLVVLNLAGTQFKEMEYLRDKPLRYLEITGTGISDLSVLKGMELRELKASQTNVKDLSPLAEMGLRVLEIAGTRVTDISALENLPLERLVIADTAVSDISVLRDKPLRHLDISRTKVKDISVIRTLPLRAFYCNGAKITDYEVLRKMPIEELGIDNPEKEQISRILWNMPRLRQVNYRWWGNRN